ncbi:MAG: hypothetical protein LC631_03260 [Desulfovibrionales bacterium]|nr:hypothetical protein [Desulfovibrionales bacterium]
MLVSDKYFKIRMDHAFSKESMDLQTFIFENSREQIGYSQQLELLYKKIDAFFAQDPDSIYYLNPDELITLLISWYGLKGNDPIRFNTVLQLFDLTLNEAMDLDEEEIQRSSRRAASILLQSKMGLLGHDDENKADSQIDDPKKNKITMMSARYPRAVALIAFKIIQSPNFHDFLQYVAVDARFELIYYQKKKAFLNKKKAKSPELVQ